MNPQTHAEATQYYESKLKDQLEILDKCARRWSSMSYLRGGLFLLSLVPLFLAMNSVFGLTTGWLYVAAAIFLSFLVVAYLHEGMQSDLRQAKLLSTMHRESIARCRRSWPQIKVPDIDVEPPYIATSTDLDLFGTSSVFKLLGITRTPLGTETLKSWILHGADANEIKLRQQAIDELKPEFDWRLQFRLVCEKLAVGQSGPSRFVEWSESSNWFEGRMWVLWLSRVTAAVSLLAIFGTLFGLVPLTISGPTVMVTFVVNFVMSVFYAGNIHDVFNQISSRTDEAMHYIVLFDLVSDFPAKSEKLRALQILLHDKDHDAQKTLHSLGRLTWLANIRRNGVLFVIYLIFEFLFFWDVHCLDRLEQWKRKNGSYVRGWFTDIAEWEALVALAKLAGDEPEWQFPQVSSKGDQRDTSIICNQVGHPLLDDARVRNDVQVGPAGTVLLVTGSNMSGKSTLLRSIGVNVVLAQMGSVVCADSMMLSPMHIETSMRIVDSLSDGVSFFMAELKRLKEIVDTAAEFEQDDSRTLFFLLDEILQGTNSRERQIAVSRVVRKLIDEKAIGAISTHDLDLATTDELKHACQTVHFSEQFRNIDGKRKMTFDYKMRPGIAETTNALKLLEIVGLGE